MLRFLVTPRWLAVHLALVVALAICVIAGWWQLNVFQDTTSRQDERDQPPTAIDQLVTPGHDIGTAADRPVRAEGQYLNEHQFIIPGRIHDSTLGWFVLIPLETADGTIVPVLRGWVEEPDDVTEPASSEVTVHGYLLPPETPQHATVRSDQELGDSELGYIAPEPFSTATGLPGDHIVHGYVLRTTERPDTPGVTPVDVDELAPIRNVSPWQNLSYTAQWWIFGLAAIAFWASAVRSGVRSRRTAEGPDPDDPDHPGETEQVSESARPHVPS
ncbi:SURF1 family protein [Phytoactinopolyspora halophila]|nr:SURF1 family protein [Phytoactinopolyspora halophila]